MERTGLTVAGPTHDSPAPATAAAIVSAYETAAKAVADGVASWTDATLEVEDEMYGEKWPRGLTLQALLVHQAHHRGQIDRAHAPGRPQGPRRLRPRPRGVDGLRHAAPAV